MKCVMVADIQIMSHIVSDSCPLSKLDGGLVSTDKAVVDWLTSYGTQTHTTTSTSI